MSGHADEAWAASRPRYITEIGGRPEGVQEVTDASNDCVHLVWKGIVVATLRARNAVVMIGATIDWEEVRRALSDREPR